MESPSWLTSSSSAWTAGSTSSASLHLPLLVCLFVLYRFGLAIYRCYFHPLAKYPGPFLAKCTNLYILSTNFTACTTYTRHALHQKYGPIVRLGPDELSFADEASIKDIYGQSAEPCLKSPVFYRGFTLTGLESVFSTVDRVEHARMRRLLSHGFSQQGVLHFQHEIARMVERFITNVQAAAQTQDAVELHDVTHDLFRDITSQLAFAKSFDTLSGRRNASADDMDTYFDVAPMFGVLPWARYLPFGMFRAAREAQPRIRRAVTAMIDEFRGRLRAGTAEQGLLRHMIEAKDEETRSQLSEGELIENSVIFIVAGTGTSATTVLYLLYEMARRPALQKRLEEEIREAFPVLSVLPDYETANKLPFLNCVLQETLRLRGPINTAGLRVSPGKIVGGEYVPAGFIVSNQPYTTHRDGTVYPNPESFIPDRWENATPSMKTMFRPFSIGARNCIGMHIARVQIILAVCALYQQFDLTLDPRVTKEMMVMRDLGLMSPIGRKLWMKATPRS